MFTIATWNVNSLRVRLPHLMQWINQQKLDVIALQETKCEDHFFPVAEIKALGYECVFSGQKTYNGVALLSRYPITDVVTQIPNLEDPQKRVLCATIQDIRIINLYVPNGSEVGSEKYEYKLNWLKQLNLFIQQELKKYPKLIILGDFNIAPEDRDVHDPKAWEGSVLVSEPERTALREILALGLQDTFRVFENGTGHYSWWDYRTNGWLRQQGLRIDLILMSNALSSQCQACVIDKAPRSWERPSDHTPVMASFEQ